MDKYASQQSFGGQRASVNRSVIVVADGQIEPGIIVGISSAGTPLIRTLGAFASGKGDSTYGASDRIEFQDCASPQALEESRRMSNAPFWTWPPRV